MITSKFTYSRALVKMLEEKDMLHDMILQNQVEMRFDWYVGNGKITKIQTIKKSNVSELFLGWVLTYGDVCIHAFENARICKNCLHKIIKIIFECTYLLEYI